MNIITPDTPQNEMLDLITWESTNDFNTVALLCEYYNVEHAEIDGNGDVWIGNANGKWLNDEELKSFIEWACNH